MPGTVAELKRHVWSRLGVRKHLAGRKAADELVELAIENWRTEYLRAALSTGDADQFAAVQSDIVGSMKRMHEAVGQYGNREYGFLWVFLFQALASAIVQILIKWWLESPTNRVMLEGWKMEATR